MLSIASGVWEYAVAGWQVRQAASKLSQRALSRPCVAGDIRTCVPSVRRNVLRSSPFLAEAGADVGS